MKKYTKLLMAALLVMTMFIFAGCSEAGNGYFNTAKELSTMDHYTYDGQMKISMDLGDLVGGDSEADMSVINDMLKDITVNFNGKYDSKTAAYYIDMNMQMGKYKLPMEMYLQGDKMLVSTDSIINMLTYMEAEQSEIDATKAALGSVKWINYNDLENELGSTLQGMDMVQMSQSLYAVMSYFNEHSFKNLDLGCFSGNAADGYTLNINDSNIKTVIQGLVKFTKDNSAAICADIDAQKSAIDNGVFAAYGLNSQTIKDTVKEIANCDGDEQFNKGVDDIYNMIKGSNLKSTLQKTANNKYTEKANAKIALDIENTKMSVSIDSTINYDGTKAVEINVPKDGIDTLGNIAKGLNPTELDATLYMQDNQICLVKNYAASLFNTVDFIDSQAIMKDDYNYFPMRQIAEMFGETVDWDAKANKAYVIRGSEKIDMTGFVKNDRTYVKLRDFEKLGYAIDYTYDADLGGIATINYVIK